MKDIKKFILESSQDDLEDMTNDLSEWWDTHCTEDGYDSRHAFMDDMKAMADEENDSLVDDAFNYLEDECGCSFVIRYQQEYFANLRRTGGSY